MHFSARKIILFIVFALLALPSAAGATVFSENGSRDTTGFEGSGLVYAEGTAGAGKYVWFVDHRAGEDVLRGYDQSNPANSTALATIDGTPGVGPGEIGEVGGIAFNSAQNLLFVTDRTHNRVIVYPRSNADGPNDPVDYANAFAVNNFAGGSGFTFTDPRGIGYDPINGVMWMSLTDDIGHHGTIKFSATPAGSSFNWLTFTWDPTGGTPGALAIDPATGSTFRSIEGRHHIWGLSSALDAVVGTYTSPDSLDYSSVYVDSPGNRVFGANAEAIDVFSLRTARLLGSVAGLDFNSTNVSLSGVPGSRNFFLANTTAPLARNLLATLPPTCTLIPTPTIPAGTDYSFTPNCTDTDGSTIKELELTNEPGSVGNWSLGDYNGPIEFTTDSGDIGGADIGYRVTTQDGRSIEYHQAINVGPPDTAAPIVTINAPTNGSTFTTSPVQVNYSVSDNYDGAPACNVPNGANYIPDVGSNQITIICEDDVGNVGSATVNYTYDPPDTAAPDVTITAPDDGDSVSSTSVVVNYSVTDNEDGSPTCDIADGETVSLMPGSNTITVNCTDDSENTGSDSVQVTSDVEPPTVTITSPADNAALTTSSVPVSFTVNDALDASPSCNRTSGSSAALNPGSNTITVTCTDAAGNSGSDTVSVVYDTAPPTVTITSPADGFSTASSVVPVTYTVSDAQDPAPSCTSVSGDQFPLSTLGSNTLVVSCTDAAGRVGSDSITVIRDVTAPDITIDSPTDGAVLTSASVSLSYTVSDLDDPSPSCSPASGSMVALSPGSNTITVNCADAAGNASYSSANVTYDVAAPTVEISAPTDGASTSSPTIAVSFTVSDAQDPSPSCDLASGDEVSLTPGPNTITVSCTDDAGRTGTDSISVIYDDATPTVTITAPAYGASITDDFVSVDYTAEDAIDTNLDCSRPSGATFVELDPGYNTLTISCTDDAGNTGTDSVEVFYDTEAPEVSITAPTTGAKSTTAEVELSFTASDDHDFSDGEVFIASDCDHESGDPVTLAPGLNTLTVTCTDAAGRSGSDSIDITYYPAGPTVSINMPVAGATLETNPATVHYTVSDPVDNEPTCSIADGAGVQLVEGVNSITVSCTNAAGLVGSDTVSITYAPKKVQAQEILTVRQNANLEPTSGEVLVKLPGSDKWIPLSEALLVPVGTIIDARKGTAHLTLANQDGTTYDAYFWAGVFQVFQGTGNQPIATMKIIDQDGNPTGTASAASAYPALQRDPFKAVRIAKRGKKKGGLWGNGKGKFRTSGSGGSATVRGTKWYVANYENGTLFSVARGIVNVKPVHGNCFDLKAGESRFIEFKPLTPSQRLKKLDSSKPSRPKKGCI